MARGRRRQEDPAAVLERDLASGRPSPLYVLSGDDAQARREALERIKGLIDPDLVSLNLHLLQEGKVSVSRLVNLARTLPMLGGRRVIVPVRLRSIPLVTRCIPL